MGLRIAVFGQAPIGREVSERITALGHEIVGVYTPPPGARPDPLAELAVERGLPLFRYKAFRSKGVAIPKRVAEYRALGAELNVLPFTTAILPPEITELPRHGSLCFHPSLLPAYRGGNALAWQIILGAKETGVSVFKVTEGVDEGPLVVQKGGVEIGPTDTAASLYFDRLYPLAVEAIVEAVENVADGTATYTPQPEQGASFQGLVDDEVARIDWSRPAGEIDRLVRGCDPNPGAWAESEAGGRVRLFGCELREGEPGAPAGTVLGAEDGRLLVAVAGGRLSIGRVRIGDGGKVPAAGAGLADVRLR